MASLADEPRAEWARGWQTLAGATCAIAAGQTMLAYTSGYFVKPLEAAFGWSRAQISFGTTVVMLVGAVALPIAGMLTDRLGSRRVARIAMPIYALLCLAMTVIPASLIAYYVILAGMSAVGAATVSIVFAPLVAARFHHNRGLALAIMMSGTAIILIPLAPILVHINTTIGWRAGYLMLGLAALLLGLPGALLATRGADARQSKKQGFRLHGEGGLLRVALQPSFWKILVGVVASCVPLGGFLNQLAPLLSDRGISIGEVGALASLFGAVTVIGRGTSGVLLDRFDPPKVAMTIMILAAGGALLMVRADTMLLSALVILLIGAAMGAEGDLQAYFVAREFGLAAYATIFGTIATFTSISIGSGAFLFGSLYAVTGGYALPLTIAAGCFLLSGLSFGILPGRTRAAG